MNRISLVTGEAGTGKTTWLMDRMREYAPQFITTQYRKVLAITRMHGARRRVDMKLRQSDPGIQYSVSTIDGFALSIVNRWRMSLGCMKPVHAVDGNVDFVDAIYSIDADFGKVLRTATQLMKSPTVRRIIGESYPLVLIDEFQDCHSHILEFVKTLSTSSTLVLAADDFQLLDTSVPGCPAVDWVTALQKEGAASVTELTTCHRTSVQSILAAARCLRNNVRSDVATIPLICCQNEGPVAWKIIEALIFNSSPWRGTTALICPSHDPFLNKVFTSCDNQLKRKNLSVIQWHEELTTEEERKKIRRSLGLTSNDARMDTEWNSPSALTDPVANHIVSRTLQFARLRGIQPIHHELVTRQLDTALHEKRAYSTHFPSKTVTTVHGAKNREFDNVFILWTYKLPPDRTQQRRLLYNAVTRSKQNCMVLVWGDVARAQSDPVLSLLGPPRPAFQQRVKRRARSARGI